MKQPAAPLPWYHLSLTPAICVKGQLKVAEVFPFGEVTLDDGTKDWGRHDDFTKQNAEYIVEACNNYPKAIEWAKYFWKMWENGKTSIPQTVISEFIKFLRDTNEIESDK